MRLLLIMLLILLAVGIDTGLTGGLLTTAQNLWYDGGLTLVLAFALALAII